MIRRIVKMTFRTDLIQHFEQLFEANKDHIRSFPGCSHLELWQDISDERVFFTYSHWSNQAQLDRYRQSELFKNVWSQTKVLFDDAPKAWSVNMKAIGFEV